MANDRSVMFIDRSNPFSIAYYQPSTGERPTVLEDLEAQKVDRQMTVRRTDIVLINDPDGQQYTVHAGTKGLMGGGLSRLTSAELFEAERLRLRILGVCELYPIWRAYLDGDLTNWKTEERF